MTSPKRGRKAASAPPAKLRRGASARHGGKVVVILSRKRSLYSTRRLVEAVKVRGHRALVLDTLRCNLVLARGQPQITFRGVTLRGVDVVIPRIGASITAYGLAVVNQFDMMGVTVLNDSVSIARSRDKLRCLQLLARAGLDIPRTVMARDRTNVARLLRDVGGLPAIVKLIRGTQGVGVMLASTLEELEGILATFSDLGEEIVLQEFIAESRGRDIRALVVGDRVVAAMRRRAKRGEFRSNLHRGGRGRALTLPRRYAEVAVKAAQLVGLRMAGVDLLETRRGPKVMEVNSSPGFEGLEEATGEDIAGAVVEHALTLAQARHGGAHRSRVV